MSCLPPPALITTLADAIREECRMGPEAAERTRRWVMDVASFLLMAAFNPGQSVPRPVELILAVYPSEAVEGHGDLTMTSTAGRAMMPDVLMALAEQIELLESEPAGRA